MSNSIDAVNALLKARRADFVSSIRLVSETNTVILDVSRAKVGEKIAHGMTSNRQLARLSSEISRVLGLSVVIALRTDELLADVEVGLRATLQRRFPNAFSTLAMSFPTANNTDVWVFLSDQTTGSDVSAVRSAVEGYLRDANFLNFNIEVSLPDRLVPTLMAILRAVKTLAPVEMKGLVEELEKSGFRCPDGHWLSAKLDAARKRNLVVRTPSGKYVLSTEGLSAVPVSRRRSSSDIDRILALGRRKEW